MPSTSMICNSRCVRDAHYRKSHHRGLYENGLPTSTGQRNAWENIYLSTGKMRLGYYLYHHLRRDCGHHMALPATQTEGD